MLQYFIILFSFLLSSSVIERCWARVRVCSRFWDTWVTLVRSFQECETPFGLDTRRLITLKSQFILFLWKDLELLMWKFVTIEVRRFQKVQQPATTWKRYLSKFFFSLNDKIPHAHTHTYIKISQFHPVHGNNADSFYHDKSAAAIAVYKVCTIIRSPFSCLPRYRVRSILKWSVCWKAKRQMFELIGILYRVKIDVYICMCMVVVVLLLMSLLLSIAVSCTYYTVYIRAF